MEWPQSRLYGSERKKERKEENKAREEEMRLNFRSYESSGVEF